jgi:hypothetical protein
MSLAFSSGACFCRTTADHALAAACEPAALVSAGPRRKNAPAASKTASGSSVIAGTPAIRRNRRTGGTPRTGLRSLATVFPIGSECCENGERLV